MCQMCLSHHQVHWLSKVQPLVLDLLMFFFFPTVPLVVTELWISSGPHCLLNGTSVDIQCVNFGLPRPEIIFFQDTELITPGQGNFTRFTQVSYDTVRLTMIQQGDGGDYVCEARMGTNVLNQSQPESLVFCSKLVLAGLKHSSLTSCSQNTQCIHLFLPHSSAHHREPASTNEPHRGRSF